MKKLLIICLISLAAYVGVASATEMIQTPPKLNTTKPILRPSLNKILDKRPTIPTKPAANTGTIAKPPRQITGAVHTGSTDTGDREEIRIVKQQNAEDVQAYRDENGYIKRYLLKPTTLDAKKALASSVESAVKSLLATQKSMRQTYESGAKAGSGMLMTKDTWNTLASGAVATYHTSLLPNIDPTKITDFEKFIIGRLNLLKGMFDKLETIRLVKTK